MKCSAEESGASGMSAWEGLLLLNSHSNHGSVWLVYSKISYLDL
ncbi:protein of unknown function [Burkholderia multivorans]